MRALNEPVSVAADGDVQWRGQVYGPGRDLDTTLIEGWYDLPPQRGGTVALPGYHGSYVGQRLSGDRTVTWSWRCRDRPGVAAAVDRLRRATAPDEDPVEEALIVHLDGRPLLSWARVVRRSIPVGVPYSIGLATGIVAWEATDPRLYDPTEDVVEIGLPAPTAVGGLDFGSGGLDFTTDGGLDFGSGRQGGLGTAVVGGHVPTWPTIEITGPVTGPVITWPDGRRLAFDPGWSVLPGQTVVIDTRPAYRTVRIGAVSVRPRLHVAQWAPLPPNRATQIRFAAGTYDAAASARIRWRAAYH